MRDHRHSFHALLLAGYYNNDYNVGPDINHEQAIG